MPMGEIQQIAALIVAVAGAAGVIWRVHDKFNAVADGIRCQLRTEMLRTYYRHKDDKNIRQYEKENFEHNYKAYKVLGGNSFIDDIHDEVKTWKVES